MNLSLKGDGRTSKTDTAIKRILDDIGDQGTLKRRRFLGSSHQDQELWANGGLSFGFNGFVYGSCDFAWYSEEEWVDSYTNRRCSEKPYLAIEGTDCLNTRSWGSAQIQRFHHAMGPFLCGINSIYYLKRGSHSMRPYLAAAAYYASIYQHSKGNHASYLVTNDIDDIRELVTKIGNSGLESKETKEKIVQILNNMLSYFEQTFTTSPYYSHWEMYLQSRAITKTPQNIWVKDLGPKKESLTDSSVRYGHIVLGEALTSYCLLIGSGMFNPERDIFYYLFPLMQRADIEDLDRTLTNDKEWLLLRNAGYPWKVITLDELQGIDENLKRRITGFKTANLNQCKREWEEVKGSVREGLRNGRIRIGDIPSPASHHSPNLNDFW